jgi:transketolase
MTSQAFLASEILEQQGLGLRVVGLPWLNRIDVSWLVEVVGDARWMFCVDDHYLHGGQGEMLLAALAEAGWPAGLRARRLGLSSVPGCGQNDEVLRHHGLDAEGIAETVRKSVAA